VTVWITVFTLVDVGLTSVTAYVCCEPIAGGTNPYDVEFDDPPPQPTTVAAIDVPQIEPAALIVPPSRPEELS
jgi:hypothetical protein